MKREIIAQGKDVAEAKQNAALALGVSETDEVFYEVIDGGSRGIFGLIGVRAAKVKASVEVPDVMVPRERGERNGQRGERSEQRSERKEQRPERNGQRNEQRPERRNKPQPQKKDAQPGRPAPSKPREAVIPETELKMEEVNAAPGQDLAFDFINRLLTDLGLTTTAKLYHCEDGSRRIVLDGDDASTLIGHHGETLDALQYLANLASAQKTADGTRDRRRVTIDIEGYRAKREETLRALARRMAQKALRNGRSVMLEPMSAYERRIIHSEIQGIEGVSTNSIGQDNNRKIVIYLTDKKPECVVEAEREAAAKAAKTAEAVADVAETAEAVAEVADVTETAEAVAEDADVAEVAEAVAEVAEVADVAEAAEAAPAVIEVAEETVIEADTDSAVEEGDPDTRDQTI